MHYVKHFNINGVDTKQAACIELHGVPTAATEGIVGVLGIDVDSPSHEIYKCVAVNGSVYTWKLFGEIPPVKDGVDGMNILCALETRSGAATPSFPLYQLSIPEGCTVKVGDLIVDPETYLYQVTAIETDACVAKYLGVRLSVKPVKYEDYWTEEDRKDLATDTANLLSEVKPEILTWVNGFLQTLGGTTIPRVQMVTGTYLGTDTFGVDNPNVLTLPFTPDFVLVKASNITLYPFFAILGDTVGYSFTYIGVATMNELVVSISENQISWYFDASPTSETYGTIGMIHQGNQGLKYDFQGEPLFTYYAFKV